MKVEIKNLIDCEGKTIKKTIFRSTLDQLILWFTDDTFICFEAREREYEEGLIIEYGEFDLASSCHSDLVSAGFISAEELNAWRIARALDRQSILEERERKQYEALKRKYG